MIEYKSALERFLGKLNDLGSIKDRDTMGKVVLDTINEIYTSDLTDLEGLTRHAGKLLGAYAYLGLKAAKKDTEADIAEQTADTARNSLVNAYASAPDTGVTRARGMADEESLESRADARIRKQEADEYQMLANVAEKAISLIQSILRRAESERRASKLTP